MTEIKPGAELDIAVARACGLSASLDTEHETERLCIIWVEGPPGHFSWLRWSPSTDANEALQAANATGLVSSRVYIHPRVGSWLIAWCDDDGYVVEVREATLCLAICAAILKLSEEN